MNQYTLDTNIIIDFQRHYPRDIFPSPWEALEGLVDTQRVCICNEVLEELYRGGDDLHTWAKTYPNLVCPSSAEDIAAAKSISAAHQDWVRESTNAADPFLIAHAKVTKRVVVTNETPKGPGVINKNQKVPNVAATVGVSTITFFEFARSESWRF